jgi:glucose-6-phosphate 1-epimerase
VLDAASLAKRFHLVKLVSFDEQNGLTRVHVHSPEATATIYLQGAHLTAWQPSGQEPAIFLSSKSEFAPGKPIRGGVPVVFPWFANDSKKDRVDGHPGPSHGFGRIQDWSLDTVERRGGDVRLVFTLGPTAMSRSMGYDAFLLTLEFLIGPTLTMAMTVKNTGSQPLGFEDAFHTYYKVADIHEVKVSGLEPTSYIDKRDDFKVKPAAEAPIQFTKWTDRIYNDTTAPVTIEDVAGRRQIVLHKTGSKTTVVWNQFGETSELGPWDWSEYVAVETANVGRNAVTLAAGASATLVAHSVVEKASWG